MGKRFRRLFAWVCLLGGLCLIVYSVRLFFGLDEVVFGKSYNSSARDSGAVLLLGVIGLVAMAHSLGEFNLSSGKD